MCIRDSVHNGIEIEDFDEYAFDLDGTPNPEVEGKFPFSYLITAKKKECFSQ